MICAVAMERRRRLVVANIAGGAIGEIPPRAPSVKDGGARMGGAGEQQRLKCENTSDGDGDKAARLALRI